MNEIKLAVAIYAIVAGKALSLTEVESHFEMVVGTITENIDAFLSEVAEKAINLLTEEHAKGNLLALHLDLYIDTGKNDIDDKGPLSYIINNPIKQLQFMDSFTESDLNIAIEGAVIDCVMDEMRTDTIVFSICFIEE